MSEFPEKPGPGSDAIDTGISFATWQDRQLSVILAQTGQLLSELRAANAVVDGRGGRVVPGTGENRRAPESP